MSPLEMPSWLHERYEPSRDGLLRQLATSMDAALVDFIAAADYGNDFQENQAAIWSIIRRIEVPCPLQLFLREVLELTRWSEPGEYEQAQAGTPERFHMTRLFACLVLLIASSEPANEGHFDDSPTLLQFVESVLHLNPSIQQAAGNFLKWRLTIAARDYPLPDFFLAFVILLSIDAGRPMSAAQMDELAKWFVDAEASAFDGLIEDRSDWPRAYDRFFGPGPNSMGAGKWKAHLRQLAEQWPTCRLFVDDA